RFHGLPRVRRSVRRSRGSRVARGGASRGSRGRRSRAGGGAPAGDLGKRSGELMIIGVPKETKTREYRVGMTPAGVRQLLKRGHVVRIEKGAGEGSGIRDEHYTQAGATIVGSAADAWSAEMVVKVKEPLPTEYEYFRPGLVLYTYLHLAAEPALTR